MRTYIVSDSSVGCVFAYDAGGRVSIFSEVIFLHHVYNFRSPTGAEDFSSSPCVQIGSEAHPASYPMGTGGPFPGGKARPGP
jgi:hypothetical protein